MANLLFVCSGNTCRSPMAAYIGASVGDALFPGEGFRFDSAGVAAYDGIPATDHAVAAMAEWGVDLRDHRSKQFQRYMTEKADYIVCMTPAHKKALVREFPAAAAKIFLIGELSGSGRSVPDPYGGSLGDYRAARDTLKEEITAILRRLSGKNPEQGKESLL